MFLKDICLRPSCYECMCKKTDSCADITIGDYWGAKEDVPDMDDNKGLSLVMVQTKKGEDLLNSIASNCIIASADYENAIKHNNSYYEPANRPEERNGFYSDLVNMPFNKMINKYSHITMRTRIRQAIKKTPLYAFIKRSATKKPPFEYGILIEFRDSLQKQ